MFLGRLGSWRFRWLSATTYSQPVVHVIRSCSPDCELIPRNPGIADLLIDLEADDDCEPSWRSLYSAERRRLSPESLPNWTCARMGVRSNSAEIAKWTEGVSMRDLVVVEFMTLDGVVQSPGYEDEDPSGSFRHGGWGMEHIDEVGQKWLVDTYSDPGGFLLGRRTYEILAAYWPTAPEEERGVSDPLNTKPKHVVSSTLSEPLEWENSHLLQGDLSDAVRSLKQEEGGDLVVIGSSELTRTLLELGLVDKLRLMIDPVLVGGGKRIFAEDGRLRKLRVAQSEVAPSGAFLVTYEVLSDGQQSAK
jgi:dihydrofolate reductase